MKTTIDIPDVLLARAKRCAQESGRPLKALVEDGLRLVLAMDHASPVYRLADLSVGDAYAPNPLEALTWDDLRSEIHGEPSPIQTP